jgi:sugar lactone lactonase YvrE
VTRFAGKSLAPFFSAVIALVLLAFPAAASQKAFISQFHKIRTLAPTAPKKGSAKGDINPYGVAVVPRSMGKLVKGDVLVSNFNNSKNQQGTGSSIVEVSPGGHARVFAVVPRPTSTKAVGLTTALVALKSGFVVVGSLPAPGGKSSAARAGALTILNSQGHVVKTIAGGDINGPWDMTAVDKGSAAVLFVTNVLNGTVHAAGKRVQRGTVVRIDLLIAAGHAPKVISNKVIATGFTEHTDPNALVIGPTGVGLGAGGTLYVADSARNRIAAVPDALTRMAPLGNGANTVAKGGKLNDPLGLAIAPGGDIVTANGGNGNLVETTPGGHTAAVKALVHNGAGDLFGLAVAPGGRGLYFVDDAGSGPAANSLRFLH